MNSDQDHEGAVEQPEVMLDITRDICPMTFVRTRLLLDRMAPGATARIRLKGREPLANVPRNAASLGHAVLAVVPENPDATADTDCWILTLRRKA